MTPEQESLVAEAICYAATACWIWGWSEFSGLRGRDAPYAKPWALPSGCVWEPSDNPRDNLAKAIALLQDALS